eukprot:m.205989 g.205989  ORF g.205989 m.205989 type:complete len:137 (-) comp23160_c0_seq1:1424-1834(-)
MGGGYTQRPMPIRAEFEYKGVKRGLLAYCPAHFTVKQLGDLLTLQLRDTVDTTSSIVVRQVCLDGQRLEPAVPLAAIPALVFTPVMLNVSGSDGDESAMAPAPTTTGRRVTSKGGRRSKSGGKKNQQWWVGGCAWR